MTSEPTDSDTQHFKINASSASSQASSEPVRGIDTEALISGFIESLCMIAAEAQLTMNVSDPCKRSAAMKIHAEKLQTAMRPLFRHQVKPHQMSYFAVKTLGLQEANKTAILIDKFLLEVMKGVIREALSDWNLRSKGFSKETNLIRAKLFFLDLTELLRRQLAPPL